MSADKDTIDLSAEPGFEPADAYLAHLALGRSFLAGPHADDDLVRVKWYLRESDGAIQGKAWWGAGAQGPPGHAHGGSIAAVLDEGLGSACWANGHAVVAATLNTRFVNLLPLEHVFTVEAWVERVDGRKVFPRGRIVGEDGTVYAEADGVFIEISKEKFASLGLNQLGR